LTSRVASSRRSRSLEYMSRRHSDSA
jgi:hypothetical protein